MNILDRIFGRPEDLPEGETFLVVGLGNPGREYKDNRHNIGFMAIDQLARQHDVKLSRVKNRALVTDFQFGPHKVVLAKPQTFMNSSGNAVGPLAKFYKLDPERILVIYDEIDLPFGTVRLREKGGSGGHNGMKSIINHLGNDFPRLRLGVGRPPGKMPVPAYVLQDFHKSEHEIVREMLDTAVRATEMTITDGINKAMSRFNGSVLEQ